MSNYFIADPHFGDSSIIRFCNRPFDNTETMDKVMIDNWNKNIHEDDTIFVVGDFAAKSYGYTDIQALLTQLNGYKILIRGNHDHLISQGYIEAGFDEVINYPIIVDDFFIVSHEPMFMNSTMPYFNIYGHIHNNPIYNAVSPSGRCVSVEQIGYEPISMSTIKLEIQFGRKVQ